jgi:hypothetical protein
MILLAHQHAFGMVHFQLSSSGIDVFNSEHIKKTILSIPTATGLQEKENKEARLCLFIAYNMLL